MLNHPILIGSTAVKIKTGDLKIKCSDLDFLALDYSQAQSILSKLNVTITNASVSSKFKTRTIIGKVNSENDTIVEITYPYSTDCSTYKFFKSLNEVHLINYGGLAVYVPSLNFLYSLKLTHRYLKNSPHFIKTLNHILYLKNLGCEKLDTPVLRLRELETYDYPHPNLNTTKSEFFNSNFNYIYDHDSIHEAVKLLDTPAYKKYCVDEVKCSREKFFNQPRTIQLLGVIEEVYVLALERSQIPTNYEIDRKRSFILALEKVCTSITSGWFREFAYNNYYAILNMYQDDYVDKFKLALSKGQINPYKG